VGGTVKVSCLIPFRDADGTRTRAKDWILARWKHYYPDWEFIVASDDGVDPFNKSLAVNKAAAQATGDVYVILDADTWAPPMYIQPAFEWLSAERGPKWAIPCRRALRLKEGISERVMALDPTCSEHDPTHPLTPQLPAFSAVRDTETHGAVVGFLWVVRRDAFERVGGMDERIRGWGGEDTLFTRAMTVINGVPRRGHGTLMSLWHARPRDSRGQRIWSGQGERSQEKDKQELARRYGMARTPALMREVLAR
jgi:hypothetical protein